MLEKKKKVKTKEMGPDVGIRGEKKPQWGGKSPGEKPGGVRARDQGEA